MVYWEPFLDCNTPAHEPSPRTWDTCARSDTSARHASDPHIMRNVNRAPRREPGRSDPLRHAFPTAHQPYAKGMAPKHPGRRTSRRSPSPHSTRTQQKQRYLQLHTPQFLAGSHPAADNAPMVLSLRPSPYANSHEQAILASFQPHTRHHAHKCRRAIIIELLSARSHLTIPLKAVHQPPCPQIVTSWWPNQPNLLAHRLLLVSTCTDTTQAKVI